MAALSRRKGACGERELLTLLRDQLGDLPELRRNLEQARDGGADFRIAGHAVEVKRCERFSAAWIDQAERQAELHGDVPVIAWRANGKPWRFLLIADMEDFTMRAREKLKSAESGELHDDRI